MVAIRLTAMRSLPRQAPPPRQATQRSRSAGALTTPSCTSPSTATASSVAKIGMPRT